MNNKKYKFKGILLICWLPLQNIMRRLDFIDSGGKFFVEAHQINFTTSTPLTKKYFINLLNNSKDRGEEFRVVGIFHKGKFYLHDEVITLSDGQYEMWIRGREIK